MKSSLLTGFGLAFASVAVAWAVPTPVSGPLAGPGNGLNLRAVQFTPSVVHNIAAAAATIVSNPGDPNYVSELNGVATRIDVADGDYGDEITPDHDDAPFGPGDPLFAIRFSGYLNVVDAGDYMFRSYTDDGFRLTLGGEVISQFDGDRAPGVTLDGPIALAAGLYAIEFLGWEQGGVFVNELAWQTPGATFFTVPDSQVFFRSIATGVPDGGATAGLLAGAAAVLGGLSRRLRLR